MSDQLQVTSGAALRAKNTKVMKFPSGNVYRVRRPDMLELVSGPDTPDFLTNIVLDSIEGKKPKLELAELIKSGQLAEVNKMLNLMASQTIIEPRIVEYPTQDDEVGMSDIPSADKMECFKIALGRDGAAAAAFPAQTVGSVGPSPDVQTVRTVASDGVGDQK